MRALLLGIAGAAVLAHGQCASACGLTDAKIPIGTVIQELTISSRDRPTMGFGSNQALVVRAAVVANPCYGTLTPTKPLGFRYAPKPGFTGNDMYAIEGCVSGGKCTITGAVITVRP